MAGVALAAGAALFLMIGSAQATYAVKSFIVGNWYGEAQPRDPNVFWIAHFWPDGRFTAKFRTCHGKVVEDEDDSGSWTYKGGDIEVTSTLVNGHAIAQVERYHTLSYDGHKHVYRHARTGFVFTAIRVRDDYELPTCSLSS